MIAYTVVVEDGTMFWYLNSKRHREDGHAIERANGAKYWYTNDKLHRVDGPAVEFADGTKLWYLDGIKYTEEEFNRKMNPTKELTIEQISDLLGYEIKIVK